MIYVAVPIFQMFKEQSIDGCSLLMLKEEHLVTIFQMKLGSVLKFKSALASKIGSCPVCLHCIQCHIPKKSTPQKSPRPNDIGFSSDNKQNSEKPEEYSITTNGCDIDEESPSAKESSQENETWQVFVFLSILLTFLVHQIPGKLHLFMFELGF